MSRSRLEPWFYLAYYSRPNVVAIARSGVEIGLLSDVKDGTNNEVRLQCYMSHTRYRLQSVVVYRPDYTCEGPCSLFCVDTACPAELSLLVTDSVILCNRSARPEAC